MADDFAPYVATTTIMAGDPPEPSVIEIPITIGEATNLDEGIYTISEAVDPDYITTFSGDCDSEGVINLIANTVNTCLITNEEKPSSLSVTKLVINHGGSKNVSDFTLLVDSNPVISGEVNVFNSGPHIVSEVLDANYIKTIGGDCDSSGNVILSPGLTKNCIVTNEEKTIPTVISPTVSSITSTTAILGANVTSLGIPASISSRGICYGTSPFPTTNCVSEGGITTGVYTQNILGLNPGTMYYYRGYATNTTGTAYSVDGTFTTTSADCTGTPWGTMTSGTSNIAYLSANPTGPCISETRTCTNGVLSGSYSQTTCVAGCIGTPWGDVVSGYSNTAYELPSVNYPNSCISETRTCTAGTMSGSYTNTSCTVVNVAPTVSTTTPVTSITQTTAIGGGTIVSNGGSAIIVSGIVWSTSPNPTTAETKTTDGWALGGPWASTMTNLTPNTLYYVRAYATNSVGTSYGSEVTFTTTGICTAELVGTPTSFNSSGATSASVAKPTGVTTGDIMFAHILHNNSTDRLNNIPSGWLPFDGNTGRHKNGSNNQALYYKVAGASEGTSYTFGLSASSRFAITISAYRGCFNTANPIDASSNVEYVVNNTTYRAGSLNLSSPYTTVLMFPSIYNSTVRTFANPTTQSGGWAEDYDQGATSSDFSRAGYRKMIIDSGATGVIDSIGTSGSTVKHAFGVALNPL